jgi:transposase
MCMQPAAWPEPDPQIAAAIAAMYGTRRTARPLAVLVRDRLGEWLGDEEFAAAFGVRGRPGWSPSRLALVTVLQRAENLTDRLAAEAVRTRIDWKYLLGLPIDDPGFDHTVLAEFRGRVADAGLEQVVLDALLARLAAEGLVKAGGKQRTDSTHVIAAVAALNRLELAGESLPSRECTTAMWSRGMPTARSKSYRRTTSNAPGLPPRASSASRSYASTRSARCPRSHSAWPAEKCPAPPWCVDATAPAAMTASASDSPSVSQIGSPARTASSTAGRL